MSALEFEGVDVIAIGAVGAPGERTFMIQARKGPQSATLILEKEQVIALSREVFAFLSRLGFPDPSEGVPSPQIDQGDEPLWRVGEIGIGYEQASDLVVLECREVAPEEEQMPAEEPARARFWVTRSQFASLGRQGLEVAARGRPLCIWCREPLDSEEHVCVATNGHGRSSEEG